MNVSHGKTVSHSFWRSVEPKGNRTAIFEIGRTYACRTSGARFFSVLMQHNFRNSAFKFEVRRDSCYHEKISNKCDTEFLVWYSDLGHSQCISDQNQSNTWSANQLKIQMKSSKP